MPRVKHQVILTSDLPDVATQLLSQECDVVTHPSHGIRDEDELIEILADADGAITLLTDAVTRKVLASNPHLRVVANCAVGYNNIDIEAAKELGIVVTNTPGVLTSATADLTMALILAVTRNIIPGDRMIRSGEFHGWHPLMLLGTSLQGKTLGIVGLGRIGFAVAKRALAFEMSVVYHSPSEHPEAEQHGIRRLALDELVRSADVISLHAPLTAETRHLFDEARLRQMKRSAYLINTARGPLVDESALAGILAEKQIRGAALDVYEREPAVESRLLALENVVLLPHLGSATEETRHAMAKIAATEVLAVLRGAEPQHRVA